VAEVRVPSVESNWIKSTGTLNTVNVLPFVTLSFDPEGVSVTGWTMLSARAAAHAHSAKAITTAPRATVFLRLRNAFIKVSSKLDLKERVFTRNLHFSAGGCF
jgi:hypothetical protein